MATRIYSECFVLTHAIDMWVDYWVPAGMRAVVRDVSVTGGGLSTEWAQAEVAGITLMTLYFPAGQRQQYFPVRWTVYEGQRLGLYLHGSQMFGAINGFLFEDTGGESAMARASAELERPPLMDTYGWAPEKT